MAIIMSVTVTYHSEYGVVPGKATMTPGTVYTEADLPVLTSDGREFLGWYYTSTFDEGTLLSVGDAVVQAGHYYAKWSTPTVASTLTSLADEIRVLSGTTEPLGLTEMATNVNDANDEVADQTDLIAQVVSALQGKSVPGGGEDVTEETEAYTDLLDDLEAAVDALPDAGSGGASVETCSIRLICNTSDVYGYSYLAYRDGQFVPVFVSYYKNVGTSKIDVTLPDVICGGYIYVTVDITYGFLDTSINGEATTQKEYMTDSARPVLLVHAPSTAGSTSTVTIIDND